LRHATSLWGVIFSEPKEFFHVTEDA